MMRYLKGFHSVSPEDAIEIESTYKPSSGSIGRIFKKTVDFFKDRLFQATMKKRDLLRWTYEWEKATIGHDWKQLTKMHKEKSNLEAVADKIKRFLNRDSSGTRINIGDRYELKLNYVTKESTGYYRCINNSGKKNLISMMYFVEVASRINEQLIMSKLDSIPAEVTIPITNEEGSLRILPRATPWNECNKCGESLGEQSRSIQCMVESAVYPLTSLPYTSSWIQLFGSVPCSSSIVPLNIRKKYIGLKKYIQYRSCWKTCNTLKSVQRNLTSIDELGDIRIIDYIPKGEFIFGELLPQLLPPVIRKAYLVTEGDPIIFTCDTAANEPTGIQWYSKKKMLLEYKTITKLYGGRVIFDEFTRLIFKITDLADEDEYYCYSTNKILMGAHSLRVIENDHTKEVIANIKLLFRFAAFVFIFILIIGHVLS